MTAKKNDKLDNKIPMEYIRLPMVCNAARVFAFGAIKYGQGNYILGHDQLQLLAAAKRHIMQYEIGEDLDSESGLSHLGHALCCLMMLEEQKAIGTSKDNRWTLESARKEYGGHLGQLAKKKDVALDCDYYEYKVGQVWTDPNNPEYTLTILRIYEDDNLCIRISDGDFVDRVIFNRCGKGFDNYSNFNLTVLKREASDE